MLAPNVLGLTQNGIQVYGVQIKLDAGNIAPFGIPAQPIYQVPDSRRFLPQMFLFRDPSLALTGATVNIGSVATGSTTGVYTLNGVGGPFSLASLVATVPTGWGGNYLSDTVLGGAGGNPEPILGSNVAVTNTTANTPNFGGPGFMNTPQSVPAGFYPPNPSQGVPNGNQMWMGSGDIITMTVGTAVAGATVLVDIFGYLL